MIWLQDAVSALFTALKEPVPSGVYDIIDDEPLTRAEVLAALARAVGGYLPAPRRQDRRTLGCPPAAPRDDRQPPYHGLTGAAR
jgi:hypothetical protein